ncbi:MAG: hypothetical protein HY271_11805 [Deltaproteobacteria bacterium]|nr:hypothetical protein [Deltaproteobacteria bacterium]
MAANIYQAVKQAMQDLIAPQLESLKGDIGALRADLGAVRAETGAEFGAVRAEIGALRSEMRAGQLALGAEIRRIDDKLTWALDLRERIVAIEARLGPAVARS